MEWNYFSFSTFWNETKICNRNYLSFNFILFSVTCCSWLPLSAITSLISMLLIKTAIMHCAYVLSLTKPRQWNNSRNKNPWNKRKSGVRGDRNHSKSCFFYESSSFRYIDQGADLVTCIRHGSFVTPLVTAARGMTGPMRADWCSLC